MFANVARATFSAVHEGSLRSALAFAVADFQANQLDRTSYMLLTEKGQKFFFMYGQRCYPQSSEEDLAGQRVLTEEFYFLDTHLHGEGQCLGAYLMADGVDALHQLVTSPVEDMGGY